MSSAQNPLDTTPVADSQYTMSFDACKFTTTTGDKCAGRATKLPHQQCEHQLQQTPQQKPQQLQQQHQHKEHQEQLQQQLQQKQQHTATMTVAADPTLELFNSFVGKNTHCSLGKTGVKVSRLCLGTMNFGKIDAHFGARPGQLNEAEAHKILSKFVVLGGNCIDTANFFPWFGSEVGGSETIIGTWLKDQIREQLFLITKVRMPTDSGNINSGGLSRSNIINSVDRCLSRMGTAYIDLLQLNGWDSTVSVNETVRTLDEIVRSGKVRYVGVCDFKGWQLQKFLDAAKMLNLHKCVSYQGEYNLLTRGCEWEVADVCRHECIGFFAYSPLKYGFLTNEYSALSEKAVEGSRIAAASGSTPSMVAMAEPFQEMKNNPAFAPLLDLCETIGKRRNISTAQVALLWTLQKGFVTSAVIGVNSVAELEENMQTLTGDISLTHKEVIELNSVSSFRLDYPYNTQMASMAGLHIMRPHVNSSFEQLSVLTHTLNLDGTSAAEHQQQQQQASSRGQDSGDGTCAESLKQTPTPTPTPTPTLTSTLTTPMHPQLTVHSKKNANKLQDKLPGKEGDHTRGKMTSIA